MKTICVLSFLCCFVANTMGQQQQQQQQQELDRQQREQQQREQQQREFKQQLEQQQKELQQREQQQREQQQRGQQQQQNNQQHADTVRIDIPQDSSFNYLIDPSGKGFKYLFNTDAFEKFIFFSFLCQSAEAIELKC